MPAWAVIRSFVILPHPSAVWGSGSAAGSVFDHSITFGNCRWQGARAWVGSHRISAATASVRSFSDSGGVIDQQNQTTLRCSAMASPASMPRGCGQDATARSGTPPRPGCGAASDVGVRSVRPDLPRRRPASGYAICAGTGGRFPLRRRRGLSGDRRRHVDTTTRSTRSLSTPLRPSCSGWSRRVGWGARAVQVSTCTREPRPADLPAVARRLRIALGRAGSPEPGVRTHQLLPAQR
jgi:hypothetical protein